MTSTASIRRRRAAWLGAVALSAIVAGAAVESGLGPVGPVLAQTQAAPQALPQVPSFADVVERVKPAVVSVRVKVRTVADRGGPEGGFEAPGMEDPQGLERFFRQFREGQGGPGRMPNPRRPGGQSQGSGFFISADGVIVTNNHVVENAGEVQVLTDDGRTLDAKVVGTDPKTDLAVLKVTESGTFPFVSFAAKAPRIGDWAVAIGNPFGLGGTVTAGIVSARGRDIGAGPYDDFLQIDAPVNRGNSGGPTFNLAGEVVGVNTAIIGPSGGNVGIAFAIPSETATNVVAALRENGSVSRGFIGVQMQPVTKEIADAIGLKEPKGALVAEVVKGSPAEKAGIRSGDTVVAVDGNTIREARELSRRIAGVQPGKTVQVTLYRDGRERTVSLEVGRQSGA